MYIISGTMKAVMDDGTEAQTGPGEPVVPPGHYACLFPTTYASLLTLLVQRIMAKSGISILFY
jgi:hypothetical protein